MISIYPLIDNFNLIIAIRFNKTISIFRTATIESISEPTEQLETTILTNENSSFRTPFKKQSETPASRNAKV